MSVNMGFVDRALRVLAGVALIAFALGLIWPGVGWSWVGWIGVLPLVTGLIGNCPAYTVLGVSTCTAHGRAG